MADILEVVAALLWIALGIYAGTKIRRLNRRADEVLDDLTRELHDDQ